MATAPPAQGDTAAPKPDAAKAKEPVPYLVFECPSGTLKAVDQVTFVGRWSALDRNEARWKAVDSDDELAERVRSEEPGKGGVYLLAVAERNAQIEHTVEEVVKTTVRR